MKNVAASLVLLSSAFFANSTFAQSYYVCDIGGNDTNSGTSANAPWASFEKAVSGFSKYLAGDIVSFCRGGVFNVADYRALFNTNMTASNPIRIGAYSDSNISSTDRPVIQSDSGVFYFNIRNAETPDAGLIIENLRLQGQGKSRGIFSLMV